MTLSEFKNNLQILPELRFQLEDGSPLPSHVHLTEVGLIHKRFVDCGGKEREEKKVSMQLWSANDTAHRLSPQKLNRILEHYAPLNEQGETEIEVEYQADTIGKYHLAYRDGKFILTRTQTACLASDRCGVSPSLDVKTGQNEKAAACCSPGSGCC